MRSPSRQRGAGPPGGVFLDIEQLYRAKYRLIRGLAASARLSKPEQDEVIQEVFLAVVKQQGEFDPSLGTVDRWLCVIARHKIGDIRRRRKKDPLLLDVQPLPDSRTPERAIAARQDLQLVEQEVDEDCRDVLFLHVEGFTEGEISAALGISVQAVEGRLYRTRRALEKAMGLLPRKKDDRSKAHLWLLPFATVEELFEALRRNNEPPGPEVDELWERIRRRIGEDAAPASGVDPPEAPPSGAPRPGGNALGPRWGMGSWPWAWAPQRRPGALLGLSVSVAVTLGVTTFASAVSSPGGLSAPAPVTVTAEPPPAAAARSAMVPSARPPPLDAKAPLPVRREAAAARSMAASPPPGDDMLLEAAFAALRTSPERALALARLHEQRSPARNARRRQLLVRSALAALGR